MQHLVSHHCHFTTEMHCFFHLKIVLLNTHFCQKLRVSGHPTSMGSHNEFSRQGSFSCAYPEYV